MTRTTRALVFLVAGLLASCGGNEDLASRPVLVEPGGGASVSTDSPTFTIRNAQGFDGSGTTYTFRVAVAATDREVASAVVNAGTGSTSMRFTGPLLRGAMLTWRVTGRNATSEVSSDSATFRLPPVTCASGQNPWAKSVVDHWLPACSLAGNSYNDPREVLGTPDAGQLAVNGPYFGFMSLGDGGWVNVDMGGCAVNGPGDDVRVYQSVSNEPVTLYASGAAGGPYVLLEARKFCGNRLGSVFSRVCTFDLGAAGLEEARYFRIEDGELYPCPGDTDSEGSDIDAIEILNQKP